MAETSSIEHLGKIKVSASVEVYSKNATLANFPDVMGNPPYTGTIDFRS